MSPTVEGAGVELAYTERGSGPAVLLVHGIADDREGWADVQERLGSDVRAIAYDRRGWGESGAPEPYLRTTVEEQAEDAAALLRALGAGPAVACGRDVGALVCLDLVKRHGALVAGAVLIDPSVLQLSALATEVLAEERDLLETTLRERGPAAAVDAWLDVQPTADERRHRCARAHPVTFFADYGAIPGWPLMRSELREMEAPIRVVITDTAPAHVVEAARRLVDLLPSARLAPADPAAAVAELIA